jgi:hypothetical protein
MPKMRITNGFPNTNGKGNLLTGDLLEGVIRIGNKLIIDEKTKIPIIEVAILPEISSRKLISITIPREYDYAVIWHTLYGKEFEIENDLNSNSFIAE